MERLGFLLQIACYLNYSMGYLVFIQKSRVNNLQEGIMSKIKKY